MEKGEDLACHPCHLCEFCTCFSLQSVPILVWSALAFTSTSTSTLHSTELLLTTAQGAGVRSTVLPESRRKYDRRGMDTIVPSLHEVGVSTEEWARGDRSLLSDSRLDAAVVFAFPRPSPFCSPESQCGTGFILSRHTRFPQILRCRRPAVSHQPAFCLQTSCSMRTPSYLSHSWQFDLHIGKSQSDHCPSPPACPTIMRSADAWKHQDCNGY